MERSKRIFSDSGLVLGNICLDLKNLWIDLILKWFASFAVDFFPLWGLYKLV